MRRGLAQVLRDVLDRLSIATTLEHTRDAELRMAEAELREAVKLVEKLPLLLACALAAPGGADGMAVEQFHDALHRSDEDNAWQQALEAGLLEFETVHGAGQSAVVPSLTAGGVEFLRDGLGSL